MPAIAGRNTGNSTFNRLNTREDVMGFENLGHFKKMFERHIDKKPKQYSSEVKSGPEKGENRYTF